MNKPFYTSDDWSFPLIKEAYKHCEEIAVEELGLDCYPNIIEIISSEQMLDAYSSNGLPSMYQHWSFGKSFVRNETNYRRGNQGLAYEIVVNLNPCINYLMEENSMTMQTLVIAHAAFGHNSFFKNNYLFKEWTVADSMMDYLVFAKNFIAECEEKYGLESVESLLDICHSLEFQGISRYKKKRLDKKEAKARENERKDWKEKNDTILWKSTVETKIEIPELEDMKLDEPEENILYFLEKKSPILEDWEREVIRIVRKLAQYYYPQIQTKVANEGWASFVHHYIMNRLWEKGLISDGHFLEFAKSHTGVVYQPTYSGYLNPYWLGFNTFSEIKRMCQTPTKEDEQLYPQLAGRDWVSECKNVMMNYRDESFVRQFLTPNLIRSNHLFTIQDSSDEEYFLVTNIQDDYGYDQIRKKLAAKYDISNIIPDIQITDVDYDNRLNLKYTPNGDHQLELRTTTTVIQNIESLWGHPVNLNISNDVDDVLSSDDI